MARDILEQPNAFQPGFIPLLMVFMALVLVAMVVFSCAYAKEDKSEANDGKRKKRSHDANGDVWVKLGISGFAGSTIIVPPLEMERYDRTGSGSCCRDCCCCKDDDRCCMDEHGDCYCSHGGCCWGGHYKCCRS